MSLGQEIAPFLPFLRRHARAVFGSQAHGDVWVRATLDAIVADPQSFPRDVNARLGLFRVLYKTFDTSSLSPAPSKVLISDPEGIAQRRLRSIAGDARRAMLLTALEGFSAADAGYIMQIPNDEVERLVAQALAEIERQTRTKVLLIEDEPIIAMDLETIVRDLGHGITAIAITREEAVASVRREPPGLVLADIQLADDSSGIDAVKDILAMIRVPVIFITAFPERLLTGERPEPTFLISKPFQRSTVKAAIAQALFFNAASLPADAEPPAKAAPDPPGTAGLRDVLESILSPKGRLIPANQVAPLPGPVNASVEAGQLRLASETNAASATPAPAMEAVRQLHLKTARRLCREHAGSNLGAGFTARLETVRATLARPLTAERTLQLAIQTRGLEAMLPQIAERLDDATAADLRIFIGDLMDTLRQFGSFRSFLEEAASFPPISLESHSHATNLASILEQQPDAIVAPELKEAIAGVRHAAEQQSDPVARLGLLRSIGNVFRAIGRSFNKHGTAIRKKAGDTFDNNVGTGLGTLASLLVAAPAVAGLSYLALAFPQEFAFVTLLLAAARKLLK